MTASRYSCMRVVGVIFFICYAILAPRAWPHPLGNYSINQYLLLDLRKSPPAFYYLVDMAEIPSFTELDLLDTDFDSEVTDEEIEKYLGMKIPPLLANLSLRLNGNPVELELRDRELALLAGEGGMVIFNILLEFRPKNWTEAALPFEIAVESTNYAEESGVRECMLILDNHYRDDTRSLGEDRLKYQTLVFLDENKNPVYQDFDAEFEVRLGEAEGEPITGKQATRLAFEWTSTAKTAKEMGEEALVAAFEETVEDTAPAAPAARPQPDESPRQPAPEPATDSEAVPAPPAPPQSSSRLALLVGTAAALAILAALAVGFAIGRRSR